MMKTTILILLALVTIGCQNHSEYYDCFDSEYQQCVDSVKKEFDQWQNMRHVCAMDADRTCKGAKR